MKKIFSSIFSLQFFEASPTSLAVPRLSPTDLSPLGTNFSRVLPSIIHSVPKSPRKHQKRESLESELIIGSTMKTPIGRVIPVGDRFRWGQSRFDTAKYGKTVSPTTKIRWGQDELP
jgi:hypothetical protein